MKFISSRNKAIQQSQVRKSLREKINCTWKRWTSQKTVNLPIKNEFVEQSAHDWIVEENQAEIALSTLSIISNAFSVDQSLKEKWRKKFTRTGFFKILPAVIMAIAWVQK